MNDTVDGHYTLGDALVAVVGLLLIFLSTPVGWLAILFLYLAFHGVK